MTPSPQQSLTPSTRR